MPAEAVVLHIFSVFQPVTFHIDTGYKQLLSLNGKNIFFLALYDMRLLSLVDERLNWIMRYSEKG